MSYWCVAVVHCVAADDLSHRVDCSRLRFSRLCRSLLDHSAVCLSHTSALTYEVLSYLKVIVLFK